jgi:Flp pilus assembly pilin Flp
MSSILKSLTRTCADVTAIDYAVIAAAIVVAVASMIFGVPGNTNGTFPAVQSAM